MGILHKVLSLFGLGPFSIQASQTTASNVLTALQKSDAARLKQGFWWPLRLLLTEKRTKRIWSALDSSLGPVESFTSPELHEHGRLGVRTMKSLVRFQRGRTGVSIKLWGDKVVGLSVHAPVTIGLSPKWEAPEYVDEWSFIEEEVNFRPYWVWPCVKGLLNVPKRKGRKAAVLLVPGSGMLDRDASIGATYVSFSNKDGFEAVQLTYHQQAIQRPCLWAGNCWVCCAKTRQAGCRAAVQAACHEDDHDV